jgi:fluoride exporter
MPHIVLVAIGGVLGANARYLISQWAARRYGTAFPYGTVAINLSGSFLLALIATVIAERLDGDRSASLLIGTGFLGAYTTFSTFSFETLALLHDRALRRAIVNVTISAGGGIVAAVLGIWLAQAMS